MLAWANGQYKKIGAHLESLDEFAEGEPLLVLMELLFLPGSKQVQAKKVAANGGKATMKGCTAFRKLEMLQRAMMIATEAGVRFRFISAEDFVEKNMKMMLAFCYASALRFNTRGLVEEEEGADAGPSAKAKSPKTDGRASEKDALLAWVKERVASYGVPVKDFAGSWTDGRAFLALVHSLCGGVDGGREPVPFDYRAEAAAGDDKARAESAFARAEELLNVQPLICYMDVEERNTDAVVMYVSELSRALRERDDARATPKPPVAPAPDASGPKKVELSEEEYQRLVSELESTRKKVGELEGELAETRISKTEKAGGHRHHKSESKSKDKEDKVSKTSKSSSKSSKSKSKDKEKKEKEDKVSKTVPAPSTEASPVDSLAQAHSDEHKKVLKLREQLQRAIERVEELAETAAEDPETVEDLPDELAWLLDTIMQKDQEATSSAALMTQLEMQMTVSGTGGGDALLTEAEKLEVNDLLQSVAEEENHALSQIHDVLARLVPDVQGKPIEAEVERLRRLALIGAERARRTLSGAEEAAARDAEAAEKKKRQQNSAAESLSKTAVVSPSSSSASSSSGGVLERRMSMPVCGASAMGGAKKHEAVEPAGMTAEQRAELARDVDATPVDAVSLPAVVERFDSLEQQLEREEPQLTEHVAAMKGTRSKAKEALKQTKTALSKAFHIAKKAERREEAKKKKVARAMAVPADPSDVGKLRAAMIAALDVLQGDISGDKQRLKARKAFVALQGDEFVARFAALVADVQKQIAQDQAQNVELQAQLVDSQTKVWERVKQLRK